MFDQNKEEGEAKMEMISLYAGFALTGAMAKAGMFEDAKTIAKHAYEAAEALYEVMHQKLAEEALKNEEND